MILTPKYIAAIILSLAAIFVWNGFLIQRDSELFKAYDACVQFTYHPDCPYTK